MTRQVVLEFQSIGKYQARRIYASRGSFVAQIRFGGDIAPQQPQHAAIDPVQQSHPNAEDRRSNLVIVVETAEYEPMFGQARLRSARRRLGYPQLGIRDQIAVRQVHDLFKEELLLVEWQHGSVGEHVIVEIGAERTRKTDIADLDGRGPA